MITLTYAGIGARAMPAATLADMTVMSGWLARTGWHLASGGAGGADSAFAAGAPAGQRTIWLPWRGYNGHRGPDCRVPSGSELSTCMEIAADLHPAPWPRASGMISATRRRAASARSRHQPSGREPMTLLPSTKTLDCAAWVMPFCGLRHVAGAARKPSAARCLARAMILGAWGRDTMVMRIPGSGCADRADGHSAGIRRPPRAGIHGRPIGRCMASGTWSSTYETGVLPLDRGRA